ncbi:hypothetical protein BTUL_0025g00140 [Botrytis tulipae]|uniref:Uncharacterized protein n=1 Tax=Botrytis tulipae TaxID=87230 RepID=A0A4Z1EYQ7_9HELO|nr:hypothetical protein BTUL_0025g00140 [Botrytis tulipae]
MQLINGNNDSTYSMSNILIALEASHCFVLPIPDFEIQQGIIWDVPLAQNEIWVMRSENLPALIDEYIFWQMRNRNRALERADGLS